HVQDVTLANKSKPGEVYGAWQRIDNSNWYATNVYKKGDIVRHDNKVY
ncbi:MAG: hypothetical protein GX038_06670, partial [Erysipelothrix sp.]|nr:hypothetical protein [Erysipelothrix sp.]